MSRLLFAALLCWLNTAGVAQQLWLGQNDDTTYGSLAVGWPAAVMAFRFTAPTSDTVVAAQVFTGNAAPSPHTLELRTHDPLTGLPGALLGNPGTWTTEHTRCWQGAVLAQSAAVTAGQDYWLVWRVTGMFHQHSVSADATPGNVLSEVRISDGATWHGQAMLAAKFRLFTSHATGTAFAFGTAKAGTYGNPQIGLTGWPSIGSTVDVLLENTARRQPALLFLGAPVPPGLPLPFGVSWTTADLSLFTTTVSESSPLVGGISLTLRVPLDPQLAGLAAALQWGILDPLAADGIAHTAAIGVVLQ